MEAHAAVAVAASAVLAVASPPTIVTALATAAVCRRRQPQQQQQQRQRELASDANQSRQSALVAQCFAVVYLVAGAAQQPPLQVRPIHPLRPRMM